MKYMDLKNGGTGYLTYDGNTRRSNDSSSDKYDDEERFFVEITGPFSYNPVDNTITATPEDGRYSCEGMMTITWRQPDITYASKTLSKSFELYWADPDLGKCLFFDTKGGTVINTKVYGPGAEVEEIPDPTKIGYDFGGWYLDEKCTQKTTIPKIMPDHDVKLYAKWIPIPNVYTVRHYYENLNTQYDLLETTVQDNVYTDDELSQEKIVNDNKIEPIGFDVNYDKTTQYDTVAPDGSTIVNIYYKREIYSVIYSLGELKSEENPDVTIRHRYEEPIYEPSFFVYGYEFDGWNTPLEQTMGVKDLSYVAQWKPNPNTPYYLEYYVKNPKTGQYVMLGGENGKLYKEGETASTVPVKDYLLEDNGYIFNYATVNGIRTDENGSGQIDPQGRLVIRYYYEGTSYDVSFDTMGGTILNSSSVPTQYTHGITLNIDDIIVQRTGYRFLGWYEGVDSLYQMKEITSERTGNISLVAKWQADQSDISLYDSDGVTSLGTVTATYGKTIPSLSESKLPTKDGYDFAGFYSENGELYYDGDGNGRIIWESLNPVSIKAKWQPNTVEISFDANGGEADISSLDGTYLSKYPALPNAKRDGYVFLGWTLEGDASDKYITSDTTINKYSAHTLVAQWQPNTDTPYTVELYVASSAEETATYSLYSASVQYGTTDTTVNIANEIYDIPGYTFDISNENNVLSGNINADGSTVLKVYYKQGTLYTITLHYENGIPDAVIQMADGLEYQLPGYDGLVDNMKLKGWTDGNVYYSAPYNYEIKHSDAELTAVWEKATYTLLYSIDESVFMLRSETLTYDKPSKVIHPTYTKKKYSETGEITAYYEFTGWNTEADGSGTEYQPGDEIVNLELNDPINNRTYLYAQWKELEVPEGMVPYYVVYNVEDESGMYRAEYTMILFGYPGELTQAVAYDMNDVSAQPFDQKTITTGESADDAGYSQYEGFTVVEIKYAQQDYSITYHLMDGSTESRTYHNKQYVDTYDAPAVTGYEFVGWNVEIPQYMIPENIDAYAYYKEKDLYAVKVNCYIQNAEDNNYTLAASDYVYGKAGATVTPQPAVFTGFVTPQAQEVTVLADDSAECNYYYDRKEYTLNWNAGDGTLSGESYSQGAIRYGATITAPELSRVGYTGTWKNLSATMPAQDITYEAAWEPKTVPYYVFYRKVNRLGYAETITNTTEYALAGSVIQPSNQLPLQYQEQVAEGYEIPVSQIAVVEGDGSTQVYYDYKLVKNFYSFDLSGGRVTTSNYANAGEYYYGQTLQLPLIRDVEKDGYKAVGWYNIYDPDQTIVTGNTITMAAEDVVYKMKWEPVPYTITYELGEEGATNEYNPSEYQTGLDFNLSGALCDHMGFVRWEWIGEGDLPSGVEMLENGLVHITGSATGDLKFRAVWDPYCKVFVAETYEGSKEFYLYYYPETTDPYISEVTYPLRDGYIFNYWSKKVLKEDYGYDIVRISERERLSTLNINTDFIAAKWLEVTMKNGYKQIHVASEQDFLDAVRIMKEDASVKGIIVDENFTISIVNEPYFDVFDSDYEFNGNGKNITITKCSSPLFNENYGYIHDLRVICDMVYESKSEDAEDYSGVYAYKNYGTIESCKLGGFGNGTIAGDANYVGGFAGYNSGIISGCKITGETVVWNYNDAKVKSKMKGYAGGFAGYNDYSGRIENCTATGLWITISEGAYKLDDQTVYLGGCAGVNKGLISSCKVDDSIIGIYPGRNMDGFTCNLVIGGLVGIDAQKDSSDDVRGIYSSEVSNTFVNSNSVAGGIIGECNYSGLEDNKLDTVTVFAGKYAGHIVGIFRRETESHVYNYISNAKTQTDGGIANVIAGFVEEPDDHPTCILLRVRATDNKTVCMPSTYVHPYNDYGQNLTTFKKGVFELIFNQRLKVYTKYYDADKLNFLD